MQDIRAALIAALDPLVFTHNGLSVSVPVRYGSAIYTTPAPAVFVRKAETPPIGTGIGTDALLFVGHEYELSIVAQTSPTIVAEVFLTDAANAIQARLKALGWAVGGATGVRPYRVRPLPADERDGVLVFESVVILRADSSETVG